MRSIVTRPQRVYSSVNLTSTRGPSSSLATSLKVASLPRIISRGLSQKTKEDEAEDVEVLPGKETMGDAGPPKATEKVKGESQSREFQAETRKLLDIVAKSLYTDKEVFVRELVSNSSDALEKARQLQTTGTQLEDPDLPFEIKIYADRTTKTLIIQDSGIGMSEEELINNLGNIGHSGSLDFVNKAKAEGKSSDDIIGQFGVGFYSVFMVSSNVTVYSKSATAGSVGYCWTSDGAGRYNIAEAEGVTRGTKIVLDLTEANIEFSIRDAIERILKKYSNFVGFPILLNGKQINTVKPLWTMSKSQISTEEHKEFYRFVSGAFDDPMLHLHYSTDSPINIRSLFYVGQHHMEKFGMGKLEPAVQLFSRKVMIQSKSKVLPDWLRFVSGVIDSEDIPLNLSREHFQDSALIKRIGAVCARRLIKFFLDEQKRDIVQYQKFYNEFGNFIKEGMCTDNANKDDLCKLILFESSTQEDKSFVTLEEYEKRMKPEQKEIFYLCVPNREMSNSSPYMESFREEGVEVLLCFNNLDEFVLAQVHDYKGRNFISVSTNQGSEALAKLTKKDKSNKAGDMNEQTQKEYLEWFSDSLIGRASGVKASTRLADSPALIADSGAVAYRKMMRMVSPESHASQPQLYDLEVNLAHPIIQKLNEIRETDKDLAKLVVDQVYDDALVAAGLMDDARLMVPRMNKILAKALGV